MSHTATEQLRTARTLLTEFKDRVKELVALDPIFEQNDVGASLQRWEVAYQEAGRRLETPTLSIATIGTTSSGKSTLVNALIGRGLVPMEADQMSAGVVRLVHAPTGRLVIEPTPGAEWETGEWTDLSDEEIRLKLGAKRETHGFDGVMWSYHRRKQSEDCEAPLIRIEAPLLPGEWPSLLDLPPEVGLELLDLPGLNSVQDRGNLAIIQEHVPRAFCLVVLDYTQTDQGNRQQLLGELQKVVEYTQGRTTAMLFVLNRVDRRTDNDDPLPVRIDMMRAEIAKTLSLSSRPDLLPFSALMLYYVQGAWGAAAPEQAPITPLEERQRLLTAFEKGAPLMAKAMEDEKFREWYSPYFFKLSNLPDTALRELLTYVRQWSHGEELWAQLRARVREHFAELVIAPMVRPLLMASKDFMAKAQALIAVRQITIPEWITTVQTKLHEVQQAVGQYIDAQQHHFRTRLTAVTERLKQHALSPEAERELQDTLEAFLGGEFARIFLDSVIAIQNDLTAELITPVRDVLKTRGSAVDLRDTLQRVVSSKADTLARAYEHYKDRLTESEAREGGQRRARMDDGKGKRCLEHLEKQGTILYQAMRDCVAYRAQFVLQGEAGKLAGGLWQLLTGETERLKSWMDEILAELKNVRLPQAPGMAAAENVEELRTMHQKFTENLASLLKTLTDVLVPSTEAIADPAKLTVPETIFQWLADEGQRYKRRPSIEWEEYVRGSCRKKVYRREVDYWVIDVPSADAMAQEWTDGLTHHMGDLWQLLGVWIIEAFEGLLQAHLVQITHAGTMLDRFLKEQLDILEQQGAAALHKWETVAAHFTIVEEVRQALHSASLSVETQMQEEHAA